ncbi:MAG: hypothetical protein MR698_01140, partial [Selenomonas sp.]|nr:hypothetical protein [Selenomonas sp.]
VFSVETADMLFLTTIDMINSSLILWNVFLTAIRDRYRHLYNRQVPLGLLADQSCCLHIIDWGSG